MLPTCIGISGVSRYRNDASIEDSFLASLMFSSRKQFTRRWCPVSEVRDTSRHHLTRASEAKGHRKFFIFLVPLIDLKFLERACHYHRRNFKSAALVALRAFRRSLTWDVGQD